MVIYGHHDRGCMVFELHGLCGLLSCSVKTCSVIDMPARRTPFKNACNLTFPGNNNSITWYQSVRHRKKVAHCKERGPPGNFKTG